MSKWALGIRLHDSTVTTINKAIDSGELVRTHLLRPTWHLVSSDDIGWMLKLTAPQIRSAVKYRDKELGLTKPIFRKSNSILELSLRSGIHLTRQELISKFTEAKIDVDNNRASHLLLRAETEGIICSGRLKDNKPTYALLPEWIQKTKKLDRDEALRELAFRYFLSRGPATLEDFNWWSGLSMKDSKLALEFVKSDLVSEVIEDKTYWFSNPSAVPDQFTDEVYLLPAYDEFLLSYKDRTASLPIANHKRAVSSNGIFYPVIVRKGKIIGTWKYSMEKNMGVVQTNLFNVSDLEKAIDFTEPSSRFTGFLCNPVR